MMYLKEDLIFPNVSSTSIFNVGSIDLGIWTLKGHLEHCDIVCSILGLILVYFTIVCPCFSRHCQIIPTGRVARPNK